MYLLLLLGFGIIPIGPEASRTNAGLKARGIRRTSFFIPLAAELAFLSRGLSTISSSCIEHLSAGSKGDDMTLSFRWLVEALSDFGG